MRTQVAGISRPDTQSSKEALEAAVAMLEPLFVEHSLRVYYFAMLHARRLGLEPDRELLYIATLFHDTGLATPASSVVQRFEVDGADHGGRFLRERGFSAEAESQVWEAIALHTTPGIPGRMKAEIAALHLGVLTDAIGFGLDLLRQDDIEEILAAHPRGSFKDGFLTAVVAGLSDRPETANGTVNADILKHFHPELTFTSTVERVLGSGWES